MTYYYVLRYVNIMKHTSDQVLNASVIFSIDRPLLCILFQQLFLFKAQLVSKAIGQAFNMAYRQFLRSNGISHDNVEEAEYCHVLESQKIVGQDLDLLTDRSNSRDVCIIHFHL